jgi:CHC2 zinc finger
MSAAATSAPPRNRIDEALARFTIPVLWRIFNLRGSPGRPCRSPFREDRSPSFSVSEDGLLFIDFATNERGNAIHFLAGIRRLSYAEAYLELLNMVDGPAEAKAAAPTRSPEAPPDLSGLEICRESDLKQISKLRSIPIEGLLLAQERKLLFAYQNPFQGRCWVITDDARRNAIARRLDGERFHYRQPKEGQKEGPKAKCWLHAEAKWPIGIAQATTFPVISLCEGGPDFLAAFALAYAGAVESLIAPVCMGGAACSIHKDALPLFRGKRVRIFAHFDEAGQAALRRWADQLQDVRAEVDGYSFDGLLKADGSPVKDLNDFLLADRLKSGCAPEILRGVMDFALERQH